MSPSFMRRVCCFAVLGVLLLAAACSEDPRREVLVQSDRVVVTNLTKDRWVDVEVWVNDHYRAVAPELAPEQRLDVPLASLVAGFGQRFDPRRQSVRGVEVTAKGNNGQPVRVTWGEGRRR